MKSSFTFFLMALALNVFVSCSTAQQFYSRPEDSSQKINPKYTKDQITEKISFEELDQNLSRFYVGEGTPHISAIPITGALIDSISFSRAKKDDYDKYEYRKIADSYKAFLFDKVSCFYTFIRGPDEATHLKNYDIFIGNTNESPHRADIKNEQEYNLFFTMLNEKFPKTYSPGLSRSIDTNSLYTQDLICGDKIDFKEPFFIQFKLKNKNPNEYQSIIELYWL